VDCFASLAKTDQLKKLDPCHSRQARIREDDTMVDYFLAVIPDSIGNPVLHFCIKKDRHAVLPVRVSGVAMVTGSG